METRFETTVIVIRDLVHRFDHPVECFIQRILGNHWDRKLVLGTIGVEMAHTFEYLANQRGLGWIDKAVIGVPPRQCGQPMAQ